MLPKGQKIKKTDFGEIMSRGQNCHSAYFTLRFSPTTVKTSNFAFVVSKKVLSLAVDRNKLKRRGYACLQDMLPNIKNNFNIVFFAKKDVCGLKPDLFKKEIISILKTGNLWLG